MPPLQDHVADALDGPPPKRWLARLWKAAIEFVDSVISASFWIGGVWALLYLDVDVHLTGGLFSDLTGSGLSPGMMVASAVILGYVEYRGYLRCNYGG